MPPNSRQSMNRSGTTYVTNAIEEAGCGALYMKEWKDMYEGVATPELIVKSVQTQKLLEEAGETKTRFIFSRITTGENVYNENPLLRIFKYCFQPFDLPPNVLIDQLKRELKKERLFEAYYVACFWLKSKMKPSRDKVNYGGEVSYDTVKEIVSNICKDEAAVGDTSGDKDTEPDNGSVSTNVGKDSVGKTPSAKAAVDDENTTPGAEEFEVTVDDEESVVMVENTSTVASVAQLESLKLQNETLALKLEKMEKEFRQIVEGKKNEEKKKRKIKVVYDDEFQWDSAKEPVLELVEFLEKAHPRNDMRRRTNKVFVMELENNDMNVISPGRDEFRLSILFSCSLQPLKTTNMTRPLPSVEGEGLIWVPTKLPFSEIPDEEMWYEEQIKTDWSEMKDIFELGQNSFCMTASKKHSISIMRTAINVRVNIVDMFSDGMFVKVLSTTNDESLRPDNFKTNDHWKAMLSTKPEDFLPIKEPKTIWIPFKLFWEYNALFHWCAVFNYKDKRTDAWHFHEHETFEELFQCYYAPSSDFIGCVGQLKGRFSNCYKHHEESIFGKNVESTKILTKRLKIPMADLTKLFPPFHFEEPVFNGKGDGYGPNALIGHVLRGTCLNHEEFKSLLDETFDKGDFRMKLHTLFVLAKEKWRNTLHAHILQEAKRRFSGNEIEMKSLMEQFWNKNEICELFDLWKVEILNYDWENIRMDRSAKHVVFLSILFNEVPFPRFLSRDIAALESSDFKQYQGHQSKTNKKKGAAKSKSA